MNKNNTKEIIKELKKFVKKGWEIEGMFLAIRNEKSNATRCVCRDLGTILRLINEGKIQEEYIRICNKSLAEGMIANSISKIEKKKKEVHTYMG